MYTSGDLGRARQADMMRRAEANRLSNEASAARAAERRSGARRVFGAAFSMLLWPVKH
jgi:hypothetical protein